MSKETEIEIQSDNPANDKKKKKRWLILIFLLMLILGLAAGYYYQLRQASGKNRLARDEMALGGLLAGKTAEEIGDILNQKVEEGMASFGIAAEPVFEYGGKKGRLGIENIPANHYSFQVDLTLEDGSLIYKSGLIDPGYYIEYVELDRILQAGDYGATAVFTTYSLDESEDEIAKVQVEIKLHVTDGQYYR